MLTAADELAALPADNVGLELSKSLSFLAYVTLWHQHERFPDVIQRVLQVGESQTNPEILYELQTAGTRGPCSLAQAEALLAMNDRWQSQALKDYDRAEANHYRARILRMCQRPDEALELLSHTHPNERRRYQALLFSSLCWSDKGDAARSDQLFQDAVNSVIARMPLAQSRELKQMFGDKYPVTLPPPNQPISSSSTGNNRPTQNTPFAHYGVLRQSLSFDVLSPRGDIHTGKLCETLGWGVSFGARWLR